MATCTPFTFCNMVSNPRLCCPPKFLSLRRYRVAPVTKCRQRTAVVEHEHEQQKQHLLQFTEYVKRKVPSINEALQEAVPRREPERLHEAMRYSLLAGRKRFHALLCLAACDIFFAGSSAQADSEAAAEDAEATATATAMPAACAMEMVHTMTLIHDDLPCIDAADLRRGQPSNHRLFGEAMAVLAGDALTLLAFEHVTEATPAWVPRGRLARVVAELGRAGGSEGVMAGQALDVLSEEDPSADLGCVERIHMLKTATLFECAVACGAIVGGAGDDGVQRLRLYARRLGLLSQVVDDIRDVTQSSQVLGKDAGKDAAAGKATYPKVMGLAQAQSFARQLAVTAKQHLAAFDSAAAGPLLGLPDYILMLLNSEGEK